MSFRTKILTAGLIMTALLLSAFPAGAAEQKTDHITLTADKTLSLGDVVRLAADRAPERFIARAHDTISRAYADQSSNLFAGSPRLALSHQNDFLLSDQGLREWEGRLEAPLWLPGEKSAHRNKAVAAAAESQAYRVRLEWAVAADVRELVWQVKLAEAALQESRDALDIAEQLKHDVERRITSGDLPRNSLLLAQRDVASRQIALKGAERDYVDSAVAYQNYTGLERIPAEVRESRQEVADELAAPHVLYARRQVDYYQAEYDAVKRSWSSAPTVSLGVKRERGGYDDRSINSVSFGLTIPLGSRAYTAPKRAEAAARLAEAERQRESVLRRHRRALHEAHHELEVCLVQQKISREHFAISKENMRLARKAFDLGESDLMDLVRVQEQYFQSAAFQSRQQIECGRATARHNQTKGIIPQ